jgi:hypothetical protein
MTSSSPEISDEELSRRVRVQLVRLRRERAEIHARVVHYEAELRGKDMVIAEFERIVVEVMGESVLSPSPPVASVPSSPRRAVPKFRGEFAGMSYSDAILVCMRGLGRTEVPLSTLALSRHLLESGPSDAEVRLVYANVRRRVTDLVRDRELERGPTGGVRLPSLGPSVQSDADEFSCDDEE